ncbi:MAG TPA: hypothetical protein VNW92_09290, partial [Polyangiaceae bacterium]|nr:hypothetical protein [Polyangiaceae bacterium]
MEPELNGGDFPAPIPWLVAGAAGQVAPLDRVPESAAPVASKLIQIRKSGTRALGGARVVTTSAAAERAVNAASAPAAVANSGGPSAPIKPKKLAKKL